MPALSLWKGHRFAGFGMNSAEQRGSVRPNSRRGPAPLRIWVYWVCTSQKGNGYRLCYCPIGHYSASASVSNTQAMLCSQPPST